MDLAGYKPTLSEVAALFGKSSRWISDLRAKGEMPGDGANLGEFVAAWASMAAGTSLAGGAKQKPIDAAKVRREAAKAEREEILTAKLKNELLPRDLVTLAVQSAFARVRSRLLSIASKLAPRIASMKSSVEIEETITELVHEALAELAATAIGVEEAGGGRGDCAAHGGDDADRSGGGDVVAGADAATEADGQPVGGRRRAPRRSDAQPGGKRRTG